MSNRFDDFITVVASGANITTSGTSANAAIPNASDGNKARYVIATATANAYLKMGTSGSVTAAAGDLLITPNHYIVLHVPGGITHIAAIQQASGGIVNISPLEQV